MIGSEIKINEWLRVAVSISIYINISESRARHGQSAILVLTLLVQYRKYESNNPYVVKLSILDQEMALHGYSQVYFSYF